MPSPRRTSLKSPPLDLDRELDEMYSSPITRPSLGFLRVATAPAEENATGVAAGQTDLPDNGDAASYATASMDVRSLVVAGNPAQIPGGTRNGRSAAVATPSVISVDLRPPGKWKVHRCSTVQDGHSANEQLLYEMLWRSAKPSNPDERIITISREDMAAQIRVTVRNVKGVLDRLIEKFAVERLLEPNSFARIAATYRIYSYRSILERRRKAGLEWVTRANGVRFISTEVAQAILAKPQFQVGDSSQPITTVAVSSTDNSSVDPGSMDIRSRVETAPPSLKDAVLVPVDLGSGLRKINPAFDSAAVGRLWRECRSRISDCTVEEVLHFVGLKANNLWADRNVRNTIGLLLTSVPEFFDSSIINEYRGERRRQLEEQARAAEENQRYWRAVLEDPNSTEEDRSMARQFVEVSI